MFYDHQYKINHEGDKRYPSVENPEKCSGEIVRRERDAFRSSRFRQISDLIL